MDSLYFRCIMSDEFFYKKTVTKSVLWDGFGIDRRYLDVFLSRIPPMSRGEKRNISLMLDGRRYDAVIKNLNNPIEDRINDAYQIRYPQNGEFAQALQKIFYRTYKIIIEQRRIKLNTSENGRLFTQIPDEDKEYLAFYTTEDPQIFICEPIIQDDLSVLKDLAQKNTERTFEAEFNYDIHDDTAGLIERQAIVRVRKLNKKIGDTLKIHYGFRCQICGEFIGKKYG